MKAIEEHILIAKALSDKNRIRALFALSEGELCACDIIELLHLVPSTVSKHMGILMKAGLVSGRKDGRWMYYSLATKNNLMQSCRMLELMNEALEKDSVILKDKKRLRAIIKKCKERQCIF
jgi:ArsR family transcriptional regulator, arsenate/arsenite/antimonite-responsive transcriptional repressor